VDNRAISGAIEAVFNDKRSILEPAGAVAVAGATQYIQRHDLEVVHPPHTTPTFLSWLCPPSRRSTWRVGACSDAIWRCIRPSTLSPPPWLFSPSWCGRTDPVHPATQCGGVYHPMPSPSSRWPGQPSTSSDTIWSRCTPHHPHPPPSCHKRDIPLCLRACLVLPSHCKATIGSSLPCIRTPHFCLPIVKEDANIPVPQN